MEPATFRFVAQHLNHCVTAVPNKSEYHGYILGVKAVPRADNLTAFMCLLSRNCGSLNFLERQGPVQAVCGLPSTCYIYTCMREF